MRLAHIERRFLSNFRFEDINLLIPELWEKDWEEAISEAESPEREWIQLQSRLAHMLKPFPKEPSTPEKVAWLSFWSRLYSGTVGARSAMIWESRYTISVISRVVSETIMHLRVVLYPVIQAVSSHGSQIEPHHWNEVRDRLRGYLVWCLRGDSALLRRLAKPDTQDTAFDPRPSRDFIKDLGHRRQWWEQLTGQQLEIVSDQEAFHDRAKFRKHVQDEINRVTRWLSDHRLQDWQQRLVGLEKSMQGNVPLFALFDAGTSVSDFLRRTDESIGYVEYLSGSATIHGSSLSSSLYTTDSWLVPDFADLRGSAKQTARHIRVGISLHTLLLALALDHLEE